jgi:RHS repeat-associated protein
MCEFLFTGRQYDPETEIYWYRARYYHPQLGRFVARDRLGFMAGMNSYEGFKSAPLSRLDPSGFLDTPIACNRNEFSVGDIRSNYWRKNKWWHNWGNTRLKDGVALSNDPNSPLRFAVPRWNMVSPYPIYDRDEGTCPTCTVTVQFETKGNVLCRADQLQPEPDWGWERPGLEGLVSEFNQMAEAHELLHVANYENQFGRPITAKATAQTCDTAEALADLIALLEMSKRTFLFYQRVAAIDANGDRQRGVNLLQQIYSIVNAK